MFGRATITLGIGPHSSYIGFSLSSDYHFDTERVRRPNIGLWLPYRMGQATILCPVVCFDGRPME